MQLSSSSMLMQSSLRYHRIQRKGQTKWPVIVPTVFSRLRSLPLASPASSQGREHEESFPLYTPIVCQTLSFGLYGCYFIVTQRSFPGGSECKESACNAEDPVPIPVLGRSPGEGNGNPLQYSFLEESIDRGAWWATLHGVVKSCT